MANSTFVRSDAHGKIRNAIQQRLGLRLSQVWRMRPSSSPSSGSSWSVAMYFCSTIVCMCLPFSFDFRLSAPKTESPAKRSRAPDMSAAAMLSSRVARVAWLLT